MSVVDKFLSAIKLNEDGEEYYDEADDDYYEEPVASGKATVSQIKKETVEEDKKVYTPKVAPIQKKPRVMGSSGMEVCVIKPSAFDESREITETLLANRTVVLNLEGLDVDIAQRIIDFTSGSTFAIKGNLQKISNYIFIITPPSVDISGDFQEIMNGQFEVPFDNGLS